MFEAGIRKMHRHLAEGGYTTMAESEYLLWAHNQLGVVRTRFIEGASLAKTVVNTGVKGRKKEISEVSEVFEGNWFHHGCMVLTLHIAVVNNVGNVDEEPADWFGRSLAEQSSPS